MSFIRAYDTISCLNTFFNDISIYYSTVYSLQVTVLVLLLIGHYIFRPTSRRLHVQFFKTS